MRKVFSFVILLLVLIGAGYVTFTYYSFIFAKTIEGEIVKVERVTQPQAVIATNPGKVPDSQLYSFAVAIRDDKGDIHTASTEDRQWAVAEAGECVVARFFKYPPWELEKGGTYFGARLERLYKCADKKK